MWSLVFILKIINHKTKVSEQGHLTLSPGVGYNDYDLITVVLELALHYGGLTEGEASLCGWRRGKAVLDEPASFASSSSGRTRRAGQWGPRLSLRDQLPQGGQRRMDAHVQSVLKVIAREILLEEQARH